MLQARQKPYKPSLAKTDNLACSFQKALMWTSGARTGENHYLLQANQVRLTRKKSVSLVNKIVNSRAREMLNLL